LKIDHVTPSQVEAVVLRAIDRVRAGDGQEDDLVEFKRAWPSADKARQLAGGANRARGADLVYVIGVDEADGRVYPVGDIDPATWFAQMESAFDEVAPELEHHLVIQVDEESSVVAIQFRTDRPPYVVNVKEDGRTEREVPLRVGTRTRSAKRHELLRLLLPEVRVPFVSPIEASLDLGPPDYSGADSKEIVRARLQADLYFEHVNAAGIFMPAHGMIGKLSGERADVAGRVYYDIDDSGSLHGLSRRRDGVEVNGSGTLYVRSTWKFKRQMLDVYAQAEHWNVQLAFTIAGSDIPARVDLRLDHRTSETYTSYASQHDGHEPIRYTWQLARTD
jgi:hypothetical protein